MPAEFLEEGGRKEEDAGNKTPASAAQSLQSKELEERLRQDIARFRKKEVEAKVQEEEASGIAALAGKAASAFEVIKYC